MLAEDLKSPCTDEVAVFQKLSHVVSLSRRQFVVLDTAPTGHTLLLLDATGSYHREVTRQVSPGVQYTTPPMRPLDPKQTKVLIVTLPETTPVLEAEELQGDLARAGITPYAFVVNNSLAAAKPSSPFLRARAAADAASYAGSATSVRGSSSSPCSPANPSALTRQHTPDWTSSDRPQRPDEPHSQLRCSLGPMSWPRSQTVTHRSCRPRVSPRARATARPEEPPVEEPAKAGGPLLPSHRRSPSHPRPTRRRSPIGSGLSATPWLRICRAARRAG